MLLSVTLTQQMKKPKPIKGIRKTPMVTKEDMLSFWRNFNDKHLQDVLLARWENELLNQRKNKEM